MYGSVFYEMDTVKCSGDLYVMKALPLEVREKGTLSVPYLEAHFSVTKSWHFVKR